MGLGWQHAPPELERLTTCASAVWIGEGGSTRRRWPPSTRSHPICASYSLQHLPATGAGFLGQLDDLAPGLATLDALALDVGGVGAALPELIEGYLKPGCILLPISIVGGMSERHHAGRSSVGKLRLIGSLVRVATEGRLTIDPVAPGADILLSEMAAFAHREGGKMEAAKGHDDAVLATALGVWLALRLAGDAAAAPAVVDADELMRREKGPSAWRQQ